MQPTTRSVLAIIAAVAMLVSVLLFNAGIASTSVYAGGIMGNTWVWIPALVFVGIGALLGWALLGHKNRTLRKH